MNKLVLQAQVVEIETVRFTPAGIPIINCTLQHRSEVAEAGGVRQVEMTMPALCAGLLSGRLQAGGMGYEACFTGFLAPKRRNARTLVFHITELQDPVKD
jgi:primosomal replication protein N